MSESTKPLNFEQSLARLEEIARGLEDNKLGLNDSLVIYEEGVKLLRQCQGLLQQAERKIELLTGVDASGQAITKPFDAEATFSATEASSTDQRLTRKRKSPAAKEAAAKEQLATKEPLAATIETVTPATVSVEAAPWEDLPIGQAGQARNLDTTRKSPPKSNSSAIDDLNRLF